MKKFFLKFIAFAVALVVPFAAYFCVQQAKPRVYTGSLMGCLQFKLQTLQQTQGERILIVGGSGAPYAVICDEVSEAFGKPCLNLGGTAYVGMDFYLQMLRGNLHEGDIVVLVPEYSMYMDVFSYTTVWMTIENDDELAKAVPGEYFPGMVGNYYNYVQQRNTMLETGGVPQGDLKTQYESFGFGPYGDLTYPREGGFSEEASRGDPLDLSAATLDDGVVKAMNKFYQYAAGQGAQVYLSYAPFCATAVTTEAEGMAAFKDKLENTCGIPIISDIENSLWPQRYFYNSNNHLTSEGAQLRTAELIADLEKALAV